MGGFFFDFESLEDVGAVAACQRERGRVDGVTESASQRRHRRDDINTPRRSSTTSKSTSGGSRFLYIITRSPVWKSKVHGTFVLNRRVDLHAIDATPARWRGDVGSSPLDTQVREIF